MLGFKAYQLKDIIRQYVEKTEKKITYKSKNKTDMIKLIKANDIKISEYDIIQHNPRPAYTQNVLKKFGTKANNENDQAVFMKEEEKHTIIPLKARKKLHFRRRYI